MSRGKRRSGYPSSERTVDDLAAPPRGSGPGARSQDVEKAQQVVDDLRAATREAREALADLAAEGKRLRALRDEVKGMAQQVFADRMTEEIAATLETWNAKTQEFIKTAEVAIDNRFDTITSILLGEGRREGPTIAEMAQQVRDKMEAERGEPT